MVVAAANTGHFAAAARKPQPSQAQVMEELKRQGLSPPPGVVKCCSKDQYVVRQAAAAAIRSIRRACHKQGAQVQWVPKLMIAPSHLRSLRDLTGGQKAILIGAYRQR